MAKGKAPDYSSWSSEDLDAEVIRLSNEGDELRKQQAQVHEAYDAAVARESAERTVAALSEPERAALAQQLASTGTVSAGRVGKPGKA